MTGKLMLNAGRVAYSMIMAIEYSEIDITAEEVETKLINLATDNNSETGSDF